MKMRNSSGWLLGVTAAVVASLCCITPVLALLGGIGGVASSFSWIEPYRPYIIGLTVVLFGLAWYQKLMPRKNEEINCGCETDEKTSFWKSKAFLGIATAFAALMIMFPHYAHVFYPESLRANVIVVKENDLEQVELKISGMTCQACAEHVKHALDGVPGVLEHNTSYEQGKSLIKFDVTKVSLENLVDAVNATGYKVTGTNAPKTKINP